MAKQLTQIHVTQQGHRRSKKIYRRLRDVKPLKPNKYHFSHQATIFIDKRERTAYLDADGEWHCNPFIDDWTVEPKEVKEQ